MKYLKIRMFTHTCEGNVKQMQNTDVEPRKKCQKGSSVMCARAQHLLINSSPEMNTRSFSLFQQSRRTLQSGKQNICSPDQQAPFKKVCKYQPSLIKHFQQAKWGERFLLLLCYLSVTSPFFRSYILSSFTEKQYAADYTATTKNIG